jgi:hypothetical protein
VTESQPKLPPDVRDRAAQAAKAEFLRIGDGVSHGGWHTVVDAVAEVLAVPFQEAVRRNALNAATVVDVMAERDALQARVDQLDAEIAKLRIEVSDLEGELEDQQEWPPDEPIPEHVFMADEIRVCRVHHEYWPCAALRAGRPVMFPPATTENVFVCRPKETT